MDLLILKALSLEAMHGWGISERIRGISRGAFKVGQGTLYPALHRLERRGWVESEWGLSENNRRAKYYRLTSKGRGQLRAEVSLWERYVSAVGKVLRTAER